MAVDLTAKMTTKWLRVLRHLSSAQLFVTPWTVARQTPLSMEFSRQEYWSGLPFSSPGDLSDPRIVSCIPVLLLFSCSVISDSLRPCGLQHARLPCTSGKSASLSFLSLMSIESVITFTHLILCHSAYPQLFTASGTFPQSWLFESGGQSTGASALAPVFPMNIQGWFPLGLTDLISLKSKGLSRVFSSTTVWKHQFFDAQSSLWSNSHIHTWLLEKP